MMMPSIAMVPSIATNPNGVPVINKAGKVIGVTQVLDPLTFVTVNLTLAADDGYLSERYRITPDFVVKVDPGLGILGVLTFALIPIKINTIYGGLPAHPLFLHVPVILIPVAGLAALALAARPSWWVRHGVWVTLVAVVALGEAVAREVRRSTPPVR